MHYLLFYEAGPDYTTERAPYRKHHLELALAAAARGDIVLAGAYANPADGALLVFRGDSPKVAEDFARADPYVVNGVVKRWSVREWTTVAGEEASVKVDPRHL